MAKRIREVYKSDMVAHLWAHQSQEHARNGRNLRFDGADLTSYSTIIGRMVTDKDGNRVALLSRNTYSPTTAEQIREAESACRSVVPVYRVNYGFDRWSDPDSLQEIHAKNIADMLSRYADLMARAMRGKSDSADWRMGSAHNELNEAREYAERFAVPVATWPDHTAQVIAICTHHAALAEKRNDPKQVAKRERDRERRAEKIREDYRNATGKFGPYQYLNWRERNRLDSLTTEEDKAARSETLRQHNESLLTRYRAGEYVNRPYGLRLTEDDIAARRAVLRETMQDQIRRYVNCEIESLYAGDYVDLLTAEEHEQHKANLERQNADIIAAWRRGEQVSGYRIPRGNSAMLRLHGNTIETSWGAEFPIEHGKRAFCFIERCRQRGERWQRNGHSIHLGHFAIDRIDADGTVHAGCHVVRWSEIELIARELGLLEPATTA